jgi:hypothetical protein
MKNWNKKLDEFKEYFSSDKRNDIIKNGFSDEDLLDISEGCINILSQFNIQKKDLSKFKTNIGIKCKKSYSQPYIEIQPRCLDLPVQLLLPPLPASLVQAAIRACFLLQLH